MSKAYDIVTAVYENARSQNFRVYDEPRGSAKWPNHLQQTREPGQKAYTERIPFTSFRTTGADPGFPTRSPRDVPQDAIHVHFCSFVDGLNLFFPDAAVDAYTRQKLAAPAEFSIAYDAEGQYREFMKEVCPRTCQEARGNPEATEDYNGGRISLESDLNYTQATAPIDAPERVRADRKILHGDELHTAYIYSRNFPELWVGFLLWQEIVHGYSDSLSHLLSSRSASDTKSLFVARMGNTVATNPQFQILLIPHIVALALKRQSISDTADTRPLEAGDIGDGILLARKNGVFRRVFDTAKGPRKVVCPFAGHAVRWLTQDLGGMGRNADMSIVRCYKKILAKKNTDPKVRAFCSAVRDALASVIEECDTALEKAGAVNNGAYASGPKRADRQTSLSPASTQKLDI